MRRQWRNPGRKKTRRLSKVKSWEVVYLTFEYVVSFGGGVG